MELTGELRDMFLELVHKHGTDTNQAMQALNESFEQGYLNYHRFRALQESIPVLCSMLSKRLGFSTSGNLRNYMFVECWNVPLETLIASIKHDCGVPQ